MPPPQHLSMPMLSLQMVQLTAELERATENRLKAEKEMLICNEKLARVTQQKDYLMKTTEMYEADKRELEQEVCVYVYWWVSRT